MKSPKSTSLKVFSLSLGCPKNLVDTENILGILKNFKPVHSPTEADLILLNTCSFIQPAVEEALEKIIFIIEQIKHLNPKPFFIVTGCLVNRYGIEIKKEFPEVDLWLPIAKQSQLTSKLEKYFLNAFKKSKRVLTTSSYAYLKISEGCNNRCSFCTIPSIRGKLKSKPLQELILEASHIKNCGVKEIILIAQDLTAYGRDLGYKNGLATLLEHLANLEFSWIRMLYLYPGGINKNLLNIIKKYNNILPYFDLPLQHAHPEILKSMGRPFAKNPQKVLELIKEHIPEAVIRTTLIVGYPGESISHFEYLVQFVLKNQFHYLGVFTYFPEQGTRAAKLSNQVTSREKQRRYQEIMTLQQEISKKWLKTWKGKVEKILIDEPHPEWPTLFKGRTWFQAPEIDGFTYISSLNASPGKFVLANIEDTKTYDLIALDISD